MPFVLQSYDYFTEKTNPMTTNTPNIRKEIQRKLDGLVRIRDRVLPVKVGRAAVNMTKENFRQGGFYGQPWQQPKRRTLGFKGAAGSYGPLLSGNNHLMNSNEYKAEQAKVYIRNPLVYAAIHNDGGDITVTAKMKKYFWYRFRQAQGAADRTKAGRRASGTEAGFWKAMALKREGSKIHIPKRRFLGTSPQLEREIKRIIETELTNFIRDGRTT